MRVFTTLLAAGMVAGGAYAARRARQRAAAKRQRELDELDQLDFADLDEPVAATEQETEQELDVTDAELVPPADYHPSQEQQVTAWEMPGRGAGPR